METIQLRRHFSLNILARMLILAVAAAALLAWKMDFINDVYFRNQLTPTGLVVNGAILTLFVIGLLKMVGIFLSYSREETALLRYVKNLEEKVADVMEQVPSRSIIARRHRTLEKLYQSHCPINHGAIASTLIASESTRNSFPKFINNILILTGVFGTIVALSIALLGASDLLATSVDVGGMGMVVHGMSTALSTTITAILCYLYFGYFYLKLTDAQTNLISAVEQVTTNYLIPRYQVQTDSILYEFSGLIRSLQGLVSQMEKSQKRFEDVESNLMETLDSYRIQAHSVSSDMGSIQKLLKEGFRLSDGQ